MPSHARFEESLDFSFDMGMNSDILMAKGNMRRR